MTDIQNGNAKTWASRWTFILAAAGSAIGLGNIWKFPYITGEYGGGAFVLMYAFCIALIGIPILISEVAVGRHARKSPVNALRDVAAESGHSKHWAIVGWMGMLAGFCILSFYSVVAGWALDYTIEMGMGNFSGKTGDEIGALFNGLIGDGGKQILWHTLFMLLTGAVIAQGIHKGLEKTLDIIMPTLFILLLVILGYSLFFSGHFMQGWHYMFDVDFSKTMFAAQNSAGEACVIGSSTDCQNVFTLKPLLIAMGHAFFTLSLGMAALMAYGAYMPKESSIPKTAVTVAVMDTGIALAAGLAIFPIVFAYGLEPSQGPGLLFVSLTSAFADMTGGQILGTAFFLMVSFAALSSSISLVEPSVAFVTEKFNISRPLATTIYCIAAWAVGAGCAISLAGESFQFFGMSLFDLLDFISANLLLPLGGMLIALFAGWVVKQKVTESELAFKSSALYSAWHWSARVIAPLAVMVVFISTLYSAFA